MALVCHNYVVLVSISWTFSLFSQFPVSFVLVSRHSSVSMDTNSIITAVHPLVHHHCVSSSLCTLQLSGFVVLLLFALPLELFNKSCFID